MNPVHVTADEIEAYLDGTLSDSDGERVESHLDRCAECVSVYEQIEEKRGSLLSILDSSEDDSAKEAAGESEREPPFTLGRYQCVKRIGAGGLGVVYLARDAKLELDVAVKVIRPALTRCPDVRRRFLQEAKLAARCHHANIVWIIHLDEDEDELYFSMEYLDGRNLQERLCNRNTLPTREAAELLKTLANAVAFAHSRDGDGIVHRDLKPANILFSRDGIPKIADFGLARRLDDEGLTQYPAVVGTRPYMSPEQDRGASATKESDIFSLGAILYQCLVGEPPIRRSDGEFVLQEESVLQNELHAVADRDLAAVCFKCLEKERKARYRTAAELSADLGRWLDGIPVKARHVGWAERCLRSCRRNPCATVILGVATVIVFAALTRLGAALEDKADALRESDLARTALGETLDQLVVERERLEQTLNRLQGAKEQAERDRQGFQRAAYALQIQKADSLLETAPTVAIGLLDDEVLSPQEFRDVSWRYLRAVCPQEVEVWDHETNPLCLACRRENGLFATGDQEGKVRLWQFGTGVTTASEWRGEFGAPVTGLVFSVDGRWFAGSSRDGTVRIWDTTDCRTPKDLLLIDPNAGPINGLALSPKKDYLATAHQDKNVRIWRVPTELAADCPQTLSDPAEVLPGAEASVAQIAFTSDGRFLVSGSDDGQVRVWKTEAWKAFAVLSGHCAAVKTVATHTDPKMADVFATGSSDRRVLVWRIGGEGVSNPIERLQFDELVTSLAFEGDDLAAASQDGSVHVCNFSDVFSEPRRITLASGVLSLAFARGGELLVGTKDGTVRRWRNGPGDNPLVFSTHSQGTRGVNGIAFSADGRTLATGGQDGEVRLWSTADGKSLGKLGSFKQPVAGFAFCKDRSRLVWCAEGKTFVASEWTPGGAPAELDLGWQVPSALGVSGAGDRLFIGNAWGGMNAWAIPLGGAEVWKPELDSPILYLAVATVATQAVAASGSCLWWFDFAAKVRKEIELAPSMSSSEVSCVAISSDGHLVAFGTKDGTVYVHEASKGGHLATASGHSRRVRWLAFSPDNRTLASGSEDGFMRLWDPEMGYERLALRAGATVDIVDFSPDGSQFAAGCRDGSVHIWRCSSE